MLTLEQLVVGHGTTACTEPLNAQLAVGQLTALLGRNGQGKSTLLHTLAGLLPPLSGRVGLLALNAPIGISIEHAPMRQQQKPQEDEPQSQTFHNVPHPAVSLQTLSPQQRAKHIAVVLTQQQVSPQLRVEELVALGRLPHLGAWQSLTANDRERIAIALQTCALEDLAQRRVATLSDGEQQRAALARALVQDTPLLLLDEPMAYLDYPTRVEWWKLLQRIARTQQKTVLISSHDVELSLSYADQLWWLHQGRLHTATPQVIAQCKDFQTDFQWKSKPGERCSSCL